ncbi:uncharacterized protein MELLADRAFT_73192 [Melampsora larici-populina 98AG31]|uniref:Uncharacterized protein n=1 Tax=Melampsora larici-populina (strain 98AG31 / pathotype 3-4-7) TaxID=747676 RepID=F4S4R2_MELLP|nr:uncharacterized protein MELLADRAFT_73192 [Melampsora larici-populina 98AG31]EGG00386.1 hypothetical protein MELLADRAFT_73192 [Melampsora larici-populina 98AG31]
MMTPIEEVIAREEEDELREKLFKIISSPAPGTPMIYSSHVTPHLSINSPKSSTPIPVIIQSKEEKEAEEFREKLYKIVATPLRVPLPESQVGSPSLKKTETSNSPRVLPTHTPLIESLKEKDQEISSYAEKISKRLDEAILNSPYIKSQYLSPLLSPIKSQSHRSTSTKKSVGCKQPSNHKSNPNSRCSTPKLISRSNTPKLNAISIPEEEKEPQIPGSFVNTPKSNYLGSPLPNPPCLFDCQQSETNESHSKGKSKRRVSIVTTGSHRSHSPLFSC